MSDLDLDALIVAACQAYEAVTPDESPSWAGMTAAVDVARTPLLAEVERLKRERDGGDVR